MFYGHETTTYGRWGKDSQTKGIHTPKYGLILIFNCEKNERQEGGSTSMGALLDGRRLGIVIYNPRVLS